MGVVMVLLSRAGKKWLNVLIHHVKIIIMGKMKDLAIDQMNNQLEPPPDMINTETGKCMWIIKDYRIWADTYAQALSLLPLTENA
jgi:hypothetical protein